MIHPNEYFDHIYCINLDRRTDRWQRMQVRFKRLNLSVERIPAIDAKATGIRGYKALIDTNKLILQDAIEKNYNRILIIEDDCIFHNDFLNQFSKQTEKIPANYDVWFLGSITSEPEKKIIKHEYFIAGNFVYTTTAMAYQSKFYKQFIDFLNTGVTIPIDCQLSERIPCEKWASFNDVLVVQEQGESDILESNQTLKNYDKNNYTDCTGIFTDEQYQVEHRHSENLAKAIVKICGEKCYDFGCGDGFYVDYLKSNGIDCIGYEGNPKRADINRLDLSQPITLEKRTVICLEVAEHIPAEFETIFIENLVNNSDGRIILSWALPGQGGCGHVNEQHNQYVINAMYKYGFTLNWPESKFLRDSIEDCICWWFKNTLMIFDK